MQILPQRSIRGRLAACTVALGALVAAQPVFAKGTAAKRFRVTVQNVTAANALSPFVAVVHQPAWTLFRIGEAASAGLAELAETGSTATLESELTTARGIVRVAKVEGGPLTAGEARSVVIEVPWAALQAGATLDVAAMIGKSNDSFIAARAIALKPIAAVHGSVALRATNYDAGSESNTGNVADFGPAGHPVDDAEGHVSYDRGLNPRGDAPEAIAWGSTAAEVRVEALD
jgi:hypothetical protein